MSDPIPDETFACLAAHLHPEWGDRTPLDVFNRLLAKNLQPPGLTPCTHLDIRCHQIRSSKVWRTTDELARLAEQGHRGAHGRGASQPVVIALYDNQERLLDGNHRINWWQSLDDHELHEVNLHEVLIAGQFLDQVPVSEDK